MASEEHREEHTVSRNWGAFALAVILGGSACSQAQLEPTRKRTVELYLPLEFGTRWNVMQGQDQGPTHNDKYNRYAVDFEVPVGTAVHASADGVVVMVREHAVGPTGKNADNNKIIIRHADGTCAHYLHLKKDGALVEVGDKVYAGDHIAWSGNTGRSGSPHLHFVLFSSFSAGFSIPFRFVEVSGNGIPKTGESPLSLNLPRREIIGGLNWLQDAYQLCRILDRRGALTRLLKVQVGQRKIPRKIARRIAVARKKGRKGLAALFEKHREELKTICQADLRARLESMDKALSEKRHADAVRIAFTGDLDFGWLSESRRLRQTHGRLVRDKTLKEELSPVLGEFGRARTARNELARALESAWKLRPLEGKRRAKALVRVRKSFDAILKGIPSGGQRTLLEKWMGQKLGR